MGVGKSVKELISSSKVGNKYILSKTRNSNTSMSH